MYQAVLTGLLYLLVVAFIMKKETTVILKTISTASVLE